MYGDRRTHEETYTDLVLKHQRTPLDSFDEEFDLLLARQDRRDEHSPVSAWPENGRVERAAAGRNPDRRVVAHPNLDERKAA
jgi:hypothetical protein